MVPTKQEVMAELHEFMCGFAESVSRMYSQRVVPAMLGLPEAKAKTLGNHPENGATFEDTWLWRTVYKMYDYAFYGLPHRELGAGPVDGCEADAELFMTMIDTKWAECYLAEDSVTIPKKVVRTINTAVARHVLDGGERYIDHDAGDGNGPPTDMLTIHEVALLADMDERSVRNACNPKLPGALKTKQYGKRTLVHPEDAKAWLIGRKGYVPPREASPPPDLGTPGEVAQLELPKALLERMQSAAQRQGKSIEALLAQLLS